MASKSNMVTFYHDIEQDIDADIGADPDECRRVVEEFLRLEARYNVPATYNVVGKLFLEQPDLIESILEAGQEVAFHSYHHRAQPGYYAEEIDLCKKTPTRARVYGYRSPQSRWNRTTLKNLWDNGFLWNAEEDEHDEPYFIHKGLVRLPIAADDWTLHTGELDSEAWVGQFSDLLKTRRYFAFGSHDCIASFAPDERLDAWERVLQTAVESDCLTVNFSEAADLFRRAKLSQYYSATAKNWNCDTKSLYRTRRFQEIIRDEVEKLNMPVVADLGSGGGVLSLPLQDIAEKIYCVDNAPGMISDLCQNSRVEARMGEVTESNLPDNSVDFVICARVIEYLFWHERLADEIKRICRPGAAYLVTFPALYEDALPQSGPAPDRIRHYFTPVEISEWADLIGPGELIGVQYERAEPGGGGAEERYRAIEKDPPTGVCPMNWVYVGTVQREYVPKSYGKPIPVSAFDFCLSDSDNRGELVRRYLKSVIERIPESIRRFCTRIHITSPFRK